MKLCEEEFQLALKKVVFSRIPAYDVVKNAMMNRVLFHPSKEILYLETDLALA